MLADRQAALAYGGPNYASALEHTVRQTASFDHRTKSIIEKAVESSSDLKNLYDAAAPLGAQQARELAEVVRAAMQREPSPYASHPPPCERIAMARMLPGQLAYSSIEAQPAWDLFGDACKLQAEMTAVVQKATLGR
jgi:hypothetical protein